MIEKEPIRKANFVYPKDKTLRHFTNASYTRKLSNGETSDRKWLIYSKQANKVFCFCCKLFKPNNYIKNISLANDGFNDWKHLFDRLKEHENSFQHITCMNSWNELKVRLDNVKKIDKDLQKKFQSRNNVGEKF